MGYTIYWKNAEADNKTVSKTIDMIKQVIDHRHKIEVTTSGFQFDGGNETFSYRNCNVYDGCKARRRFPYTEDIMKALIIMVEMGLAKNPSHDGELSDFLEPLEEVSNIMILQSYEYQKKYFSSNCDSEEEYAEE
jgi:hypothetical protein